MNEIKREGEERVAGRIAAGGGVASVMPAVGRKEKKWLWKENREKERKKEKRKDGEEEGRNGCLDGEKGEEKHIKKKRKCLPMYTFKDVMGWPGSGTSC